MNREMKDVLREIIDTWKPETRKEIREYFSGIDTTDRYVNTIQKAIFESSDAIANKTT